MRIATMHAARRVAVGLIALAIVAANLLPGSVASVQARPQTRTFYCPGAAQKAVVCTYVGGTTGQGRIKIIVSNHANGGEVCVLRHGLYRHQLSESAWIDPRYDIVEYTFRPIFPAGMPIDLWCMRRWNYGDAGIGGHIIYP
jgi:hypothetical protein